MTSNKKARSHLSRQKTSDFSDEDDPGDYLQDPDLLIDQLPQPFRMLDNLLKDVLYRSWEMIEQRQVERAREAARVKIPEVSEWKRVSAVNQHEMGGVNLVECSSEGYVFAGGSRGFSVLRAEEREDGDGDLKLIAQSESMESNLNSLDVVWIKGIHFVAAVCDREIRIFALIKDNLTYLCSVSPQNEEQHYVSGHFSPSASHLGVTVSHADSGMQLEFHKLPLGSWHTQLNQYLDKIEAVKSAGEEGEGSQANVQEILYSKPALLCLFSPPKGVSPCPVSEPAAAYDRVKEGIKNHLPTGELHILTQKYFDNRREAILSEYPHLVDDYDTEIDYSKSLPSFHFIYHKDCRRFILPTFVVIWWQNHTQLFVYPLPHEPGKNPSTSIALHWLLPQASPILCSAISSDSKLLAVGQATGVVTVWNFESYFCENVSLVATEPDSISCVQFFADNSMLGVGTEQGNVMVMHTGAEQRKPLFSLNERIKKQMEEYGDIFKSSGYDSASKVIGLKVNQLLPSVLTSVHANGNVILWSSSDRKALCSLRLPPPVVPQQCSYTSDGKTLLIIKGTTDEESGCSLIYVDMSSASITSLLSKHWRKERDKDTKLEDEIFTGNFMEVIERQLQDYIRHRHTQHEADSVRWSKRWAEMNIEINRQT